MEDLKNVRSELTRKLSNLESIKVRRKKEGSAKRLGSDDQAIEVVYTSLIQVNNDVERCPVLFTNHNTWEEFKKVVEEGVSETRSEVFCFDQYILKYKHLFGEDKVEVLLTKSTYDAFQHYLNSLDEKSISIHAASKVSMVQLPVFDIGKIAAVKITKKSSASPEKKNCFRCSEDI